MTTIYEEISSLAHGGDRAAAIERLIEHLDASQKYHEMFEALKMKIRLDLGLTPAQAEAEDPLDGDRETQLEKGLIDACRQIAHRFFQQGNVRDGWMYMRPVGDRQAAAKALASVAPNDENVDVLLEVLLHEGVDIERGYQLALDQLGTCNSITMFESNLASRPRSDQQMAARLLVRHVHRELHENVIRDLEQREGKAPAKEATLAELLADRPDLLQEGGYHLDTSHLASTVRFARVLDDEPELQLALDLARYGAKLHPQYQYPGEEPFLDLYPASIAFFGALLGDQVDAGIRYFARKADSVDREQYGSVAVEVYIDLLSRCGRHREALEEYHLRLPPGTRTMGIAPSLLQLSQRLGEFELMGTICRERDDLLGFAAALTQHDQ